LHLQQQDNVTLSENSWNDIVNKYKLYREMEVVIRETSDSSSPDYLAEKATHKGATWTYRALIIAGVFTLIGNFPVQSRFLENSNIASQTFKISLDKDSFIAPMSAKQIVQIKTEQPKIQLDTVAKIDIDQSNEKNLFDKENNYSEIDPLITQQEQSLELKLPKHAIKTYAGHSLEDTRTKWTTHHVKSYDNLTNIFHKLGHQEALATLKANKEIFKELKILNKKGAVVRASSNSEGKLSELVFTHDNKNSYVLKLKDGQYAGTWKKGIFETRQARASFTIKNGLFFDGRKVGINNKVIRQIVKVFDWDIDFSHDIRVGDKVTAVFEEVYHDGERVDSNHLLAAEFINKKRVLRTVRYTFKDGRSDYFTPQGREMKKAFIRTPISHARVSSPFNPNRRHPILHTIRAHKGTDFAARTGTAIMTTGNGIIKHIGRKGGYGKTIVVQHREGYTTFYAHMSKYKKGLKKGDKVYQGDVIGYVGSTGMATGPHLHYEFRKHNIPMDSMRAALPNSLSLSSRELQDFRNKAINLVLQLNVLHRFVEADIEIDSAIGG